MAINPTPGTTSLVDRARNIILKPKSEWPVIDAEPATIGGIYRGYVMILAAIPVVAGLVGMLVFGMSVLGITYRPSPVYAIVSAVIQYLLSLGSCYVLALIIEALAPTFGGTKDRVKAFKVAAYGATAGWLAGILAIVPALALIGALLGLYSLYLYYTGLPVLMKVSNDKALGYVIAVIVAAIVLFFIVGYITAALVGTFVGNPYSVGTGGTITLPG
ncbi:MAG TPA: Yip1 family protein [Allosphingosinicella sp.]|nr:Yip1 family protein [Allosphingosinicella sp.]